MQFSSFQPSGLAALQGFSDTYATGSKLRQEKDAAKAKLEAQNRSLEMAERRVRVDEQREARHAQQQEIENQRKDIADAQARAEAEANGALGGLGFEPEVQEALDHLGKVAEYLPGEHLPGVFNMFRENIKAAENKREKAEARTSANNLHANGALDDEGLEAILEEIEESDTPGEARAKLLRLNTAAATEAVRQEDIEGTIQTFNGILAQKGTAALLGDTEMAFLRQLLVTYANDPSMDPSEFHEEWAKEYHAAVARSNKERRARADETATIPGSVADQALSAAASLPGVDGPSAAPKWEEFEALRARGGANEQLVEWLKENKMSVDDMPWRIRQSFLETQLRETLEGVESDRLQLEALDQ